MDGWTERKKIVERDEKGEEERDRDGQESGEGGERDKEEWREKIGMHEEKEVECKGGEKMRREEQWKGTYQLCLLLMLHKYGWQPYTLLCFT